MSTMGKDAVLVVRGRVLEGTRIGSRRSSRRSRGGVVVAAIVGWVLSMGVW